MNDDYDDNRDNELSDFEAGFIAGRLTSDNDDD